ncbi:hypothetical protein BW723_13300 [Polaribacter reichenbachii]|uniref:GH18 domain-containing protein n=1 Tax=Polaribacter reichenbachii TaxID=996801 RepID=A0A1B8U1L0_9FLAO|nr:glycosyl hydrolase family 18 protein [Polaribacter reichenbachii]APZ47200.1 hypothetical protein BW723_13300 [Polaribacter reichenbachii]AUC17841.1 hypothetical protein BTO17_03755 [Polaribacter reichenbachii]OBY65669.1 hypothetical protein LPB301_08480 [Polaribacter reichenbachii]
MKNNINIAAYGEGILYPPNLAMNMKDIQNAGWTSLMVSLFQVSSAGDISFNGITLISKGKYIGDAIWPQQLLDLKSSGTIISLLATFGGWDSAFQNIQNIYNQNETFKGTQLEANCIVFRKTFKAFDLIDMDVEYPNGKPQNAQAAFIAFCEMWIEVGFNITFCPYGDIPFWTNSLVAIESKYPGAVKYWNLQCYAGGAYNNPEVWAKAIIKALPTFNTDGYIMASDWSRFWNSGADEWQGDCPNAVKSLLSQFKGQSCISGGFIWTIDQMINYSTDEKIHPDSESCGNVAMIDYVNAIKTTFDT